jgi:hypothetical protein
MIVTVTMQIGTRTVAEQVTTPEDFRGDYRTAITECASRIELATYGPQMDKDGMNFDEQLRMGPTT